MRPRPASCRALLLLLALGLATLGIGARCAQPRPLGAGFRWSPYGPPPGQDPGPAYWADVAHEMALRLPGTVPQGIWIACEVRFDTGGCQLDFAGSAADPLIAFTGNPADPTELALQEFDALGVQTWLQVEPGFASVPELIDLLYERYGHHPSVIGFGVDVEWFQNASDPAFGEPVTDAQAQAWLAAVRGWDSGDRLFLKHWLPGHMPPQARAGIVFVDDGQGFASLDALAAGFRAWGEALAPARVAFQVGYASDRAWWGALADPPAEIGARIFAEVPRAEAVFWVDFTALDVFP